MNMNLSIKSKTKERTERKKLKILDYAVIVSLFLFAAVQLFPLIWMVLFSLKDNSEIFYTNVIGLPKVWRWENYTSAIVNGGILKNFFNSVLYTAVTVTVSGLLSAMTAYAITRMQWKLKGVVYSLFIMGIMIPIHAALLPLYIVINKLKLSGYSALLIPYIAFAIPMSILILSGFYKSIPKDIEEAALIDGCSIYGTFFKIILPIVRPAIATVSIFTFIGTWNELMFANTFVNNSQFRTLTVGIMSFAGQYSTEWGVIGAGMVIATLPTVIIYMFLSEQVQESLVAGAVKG